MNSVLRVFSYLKRYPGLAAAQLFCASIMAGSVIIFPSIAGFVTDKILSDPTRHFELLKWVLLGVGGFFLKDFLNCGRILVNNNFEQNVIYDIRSDLYRKIQNLPLRWFDTRRTGDIMTRVAEDVTSMERVLIDGIELGLVSTIQLLAVGAVMYLHQLGSRPLGHPAHSYPYFRSLDLLQRRPPPPQGPARRHLRPQFPTARQYFRHSPDQVLRCRRRRAGELQLPF